MKQNWQVWVEFKLSKHCLWICSLFPGLYFPTFFWEGSGSYFASYVSLILRTKVHKSFSLSHLGCLKTELGPSQSIYSPYEFPNALNISTLQKKTKYSKWWWTGKVKNVMYTFHFLSPESFPWSNLAFLLCLKVVICYHFIWKHMSLFRHVC